VQTLGLKPEAQPKLAVTSQNCNRAAGRKKLQEVLIEQSDKSRATQQPSLFDFTRKKQEVVLVKYTPLRRNSPSKSDAPGDCRCALIHTLALAG
jgi:hypothetical protein